MKQLIGTGVALVTPFQQDGTVDYIALEKLVNYSIEGGVEYLVILGTTAEAATLTNDEKKQVIETIKKANANRVPMILGIGGNNTAEVIKEYQETDLSDYMAILTVSPYYNKPNQEGIYQHYKAIAESTDANIVLYNVPGRTGSNIAPETTIRLANEFKNIIAIKEASPNFLQSTDIIRMNTREDFHIISGDDEFALPMTLAGGSGVISVIGQGIPVIFTDMIRKALNKEADAAYSAHYKVVEITRAIFEEGNPCGIKAVLNNKGVCQPFTRLPLVPASENLTTKINQLLSNI
ncbi:4-hydroxy-tetrahydrodipicolinate synthase [Empedobacter brevis]|uniref:4-hydroxy-tetrahydrodipicolinate synthase n=1 Tax=Empedobacter brevis NBRC 14943 = ATCC 43319 TaxID=1218108 RepID=A0A511NDD2_9FLAO|nr:4-hydroxy-tetrahydrodipicolinate synthase [Empedobacter brevis]GEM50498.1 4-hydroxy-tetrahydrodipicolinate synthase [Empedobacter brevis NBRC 14943 = ATCC 43319]